MTSRLVVMLAFTLLLLLVCCFDSAVSWPMYGMYNIEYRPNRYAYRGSFPGGMNVNAALPPPHPAFQF
ncbi:hypothetical protein M3Y99_00273500 [Aphelenchoides fujianensis]|nr:hypothetical protein M3Y99_00273500 [Aphelenchoides fujianensis]